jgi:hypothetical protein
MLCELMPDDMSREITAQAAHIVDLIMPSGAVEAAGADQLASVPRKLSITALRAVRPGICSPAQAKTMPGVLVSVPSGRIR